MARYDFSSQKITPVGSVTYTDYRRSFHTDRRTVKASPSHNHTFYELELVLEGEGVININGIEHTLTKGVLYLANPTDIHAIWAKEGQTLTLWNLSLIDCGIAAETMDRLFYNITFKKLCLSHAELQKVCTLLEILDSEQNDPVSPRDGVAELCLETLLRLILRHAPLMVEMAENKQIFDAIRYLQAHFREDISLSDLATHVGFSLPYLSALFQKTIGMGYKQYLTTIRVAYASRLINTTNLCITDICYECGFQSYSSFFRAFERVTGHTPSQESL